MRPSFACIDYEDDVMHEIIEGDEILQSRYER